MFKEFYNLFQPLGKLIESHQEIITRSNNAFMVLEIGVISILIFVVFGMAFESERLLYVAILLSLPCVLSGMAAGASVPAANEAEEQIEYLQKQPKSSDERLENYLKTHDVSVEERNVSSLKGTEKTDYKFLWSGSDKTVDTYLSQAEKLEQISVTPKDARSSKLLILFVVYKSDTKVILKSEDGNVAITIKEYQKLTGRAN